MVLIAALGLVLVVSDHGGIQHELLASMSELTFPSVIASASFLPILAQLSLKLGFVCLHCLAPLLRVDEHILCVLRHDLLRLDHVIVRIVVQLRVHVIGGCYIYKNLCTFLSELY
jgi:hypothetical protein